jgi:hypothetical protein
MQILSITCDNASSNDAMVEELEFLIHDFPGATNRARCLTHILNLVVKSIMQQFDEPKGNKDERVDDTMAEWLKLAAETEEEEEGNTADGNGDDNVEGCVDERLMMSVEELKELGEAIKPICFLLTKVSHITSDVTCQLLHALCRYKNLHSQLKIPVPSSFPIGSRYSRNLNLTSGSCRGMYALAGTQLMTCLSLHMRTRMLSTTSWPCVK